MTYDLRQRRQHGFRAVVFKVGVRDPAYLPERLAHRVRQS